MIFFPSLPKSILLDDLMRDLSFIVYVDPIRAFDDYKRWSHEILSLLIRV